MYHKKRVLCQSQKSNSPTTQESKEIVAKNALTHGATNKHLLNGNKQNRYHFILRSLAKKLIPKYILYNLKLSVLQDSVFN